MHIALLVVILAAAANAAVIKESAGTPTHFARINQPCGLFGGDALECAPDLTCTPLPGKAGKTGICTPKVSEPSQFAKKDELCGTELAAFRQCDPALKLRCVIRKVGMSFEGRCHDT
jgi:hypothetical protein